MARPSSILSATRVNDALEGGEGRSRARRPAIAPVEPALSTRHLKPSRSERQRNAKVLQLITSAVKILTRDGYGQFSMRCVAAEAGVSLSTLQHYFESKDSLLFEAIRVYLSGYIERYSSYRFQRDLAPAEALVGILQNIVDDVANPEFSAVSFEIWALGRHDPAIGDLLVALYDEYRAIFSELLFEMNIGLSETEASELGFLIAVQSEGLTVLNYHGGMRNQLSGSIVERIKTMWPTLAKISLPEPARTDKETAVRF